MKKLAIIVLFVILATLLVSCVTILSADTTITLDENEKWEIAHVLLFEGESYTEYGESVTEGLNTLTETAKLQGITVTSKKLPPKGVNIPYEINISGKGLDSLNEMLGAPGAFTKTEEDGKPVFLFSMDAMSLTTGGLSIGTSSDFSFTIKGMKILETNGTKDSSTSVTWKNSLETMTAKLIPASGGGGFAWWIIPVIIVGLGLITFIILLATGVFKKKPKNVYGVPPGYTPQYLPPIPTPGVQPTAPPPPPGMSPMMPPPPPVMTSVPPPMSPPPAVPVVTPPVPSAPMPEKPAEPLQSQETVVVQRKKTE